MKKTSKKMAPLEHTTEESINNHPILQELPHIKVDGEDQEMAEAHPGGFESWLASFPSLGDAGIKKLQDNKLCDEETFLDADAQAISNVTGLRLNDAFALKAFVQEKINQRESIDVALRLTEQKNMLQHLTEEIERLTNANHVRFEKNRELRAVYDSRVTQHDTLLEEQKQCQESIAATQLEVNRLSQEVLFLKKERQQVLDFAQNQHQVLASLLSRFQALKASYEFVSGETEFSQDMVAHFENLLLDAIEEKKSFERKIGNAADAIETLYRDLNAIVLAGKTSFYKGI